MRRCQSHHSNIRVGTPAATNMVYRTWEDPEEGKADEWLDMFMKKDEVEEVEDRSR